MTFKADENLPETIVNLQNFVQEVLIYEISDLHGCVRTQ